MNLILVTLTSLLLCVAVKINALPAAPDPASHTPLSGYGSGTGLSHVTEDHGSLWKYSKETSDPNSTKFDPTVDSKYNKGVSLALIEKLLIKRINETEKRLEDKMQVFNNTISMNYMEKLLHYLNEELLTNRDMLAARKDELNGLKSTVGKQGQEISSLKDQLDSSRRAIDGLTQIVNNLFKDVAKERSKKYPHKPGSSEKLHHHHHRHEKKPIKYDPQNGSKYPIDCQDSYEKEKETLSADGEFYFTTIQPRGSMQSVKVSCFVTQNASWTVIQRRMDGSVDFYRDWSEYKTGFGNLQTEFWLGLDNIHYITNQDSYRLRIEMVTWEGHAYWAEYEMFDVDGEEDYYRLHVEGYSGNAGDSLNSPWDNDHNGQAFSTWDRDHDKRYYDNCAEHYRGAWWFRNCFHSHLNGVYYPRGVHNNFFVRNGVQWNTIHPHSSLKDVKMLILRNE